MFVKEPLEEQLKKFWEQEDVRTPSSILTEEELECKDLYVNGHFRQKDGRYVVRLAFRESYDRLEDSYRTAAERMLRCMERRFQNQPVLNENYRDFIAEY